MNWTKEQRLIYEYVAPDGSKRFADPLRLRRDLLTACPHFDKVMAAYIGDNEIAKADAGATLADAVRKMLKLSPIDEKTGEGTTDLYCLEFVVSFINWRE